MFLDLCMCQRRGPLSISHSVSSHLLFTFTSSFSCRGCHPYVITSFQEMSLLYQSCAGLEHRASRPYMEFCIPKDNDEEFATCRICSLGISLQSPYLWSKIRLGGHSSLLGLQGLERTSSFDTCGHGSMNPFTYVESNLQVSHIGLNTCKWGHVVTALVKWEVCYRPHNPSSGY
jgi:hypothetical protein